MELQNINPYLRFVQIISYNPTNEYFRAVDYHFYFMISDYCTLTRPSMLCNMALL